MKKWTGGPKFVLQVEMKGNIEERGANPNGRLSAILGEGEMLDLARWGTWRDG